MKHKRTRKKEEEEEKENRLDVVGRVESRYLTNQIDGLHTVHHSLKKKKIKIKQHLMCVNRVRVFTWRVAQFYLPFDKVVVYLAKCKTTAHEQQSIKRERKKKVVTKLG